MRDTRNARHPARRAFHHRRPWQSRGHRRQRRARPERIPAAARTAGTARDRPSRWYNFRATFRRTGASRASSAHGGDQTPGSPSGPGAAPRDPRCRLTRA